MYDYDSSRTNRQSLNTGSMQSLGTALQLARFGDVLRKLKTGLHNQAPALNAGNLSTLDAFNTDVHAPASTVVRAYAKTTSGSGTLGELTIEAANATPADGQIAVAPNGNIVVLASSDYTSVDVEYMPADGYPVWLTLSVVPGTGLCAIPAKYAAQGVLYLLGATVLTGTTLGAKVVLAPTSSAPSTGNVRLDVPKANLYFAVADAVTQAQVVLYVAPEAGGLDAFLRAQDGTLI